MRSREGVCREPVNSPHVLLSLSLKPFFLSELTCWSAMLVSCSSVLLSDLVASFFPFGLKAFMVFALDLQLLLLLLLFSCC